MSTVESAEVAVALNNEKKLYKTEDNMGVEKPVKINGGDGEKKELDEKKKVEEVGKNGEKMEKKQKESGGNKKEKNDDVQKKDNDEKKEQVENLKRFLSADGEEDKKEDGKKNKKEETSSSVKPSSSVSSNPMNRPPPPSSPREGGPFWSDKDGWFYLGGECLSDDEDYDYGADPAIHGWSQFEEEEYDRLSSF